MNDLYSSKEKEKRTKEKKEGNNILPLQLPYISGRN